MVDLCTGACGKLTSNIITVCLVYSGPHSVVFPLGPVRTQVSSSQNLVAKVNLSRRCKGGQKAVVKLSSEVSGMCLLAAVRFNMAGSVCSHRWPDCCFFFSSFQDRKGSPAWRSLFNRFEKRNTQIESICEKKAEAKRKKRRAEMH